MNIHELDPGLQQDALSAAHEAGHAVICEVLGRPYTRVTLGDDGSGPRVDTPGPDPATRHEVQREVLCALAGLLAEAMIFKGRAPMLTVMGGLVDSVRVQALLGPRARDKRLVEQLLTRSLELVTVNLRAIKRVAKVLIAERSLTRGEVQGVLRGLALAG